MAEVKIIDDSTEHIVTKHTSGAVHPRLKKHTKSADKAVDPQDSVYMDDYDKDFKFEEDQAKQNRKEEDKKKEQEAKKKKAEEDAKKKKPLPPKKGGKG